jgi:hypothetical protein
LCRLVIYFNTKLYYTLANTLGIIATGGIVFAISVNEGLSQGFWLYYLVTPLMTLSFFANYNKKIPILSFIFYAILFVTLVYTYFYEYTNDTTISGFTLILFANFLVVLVFILFFTYNFQYISNQAYANIAAQNEILLLKSKEIDGLVTALNDRVKNNIQVMSSLSEMDLMNNRDTSPLNYSKRHAMRLKILDVTYKMVHEHHTEKRQYYSFFLDGYATALQKTLSAYIQTVTTAAGLCTKTPLNPKHFDGLMILYNEVLLYMLFEMKFNTPIVLHLIYKTDINQDNILSFTVEKQDAHKSKRFTPNAMHTNFALSQHINIVCSESREQYCVTFKSI